MGRYTSKALGLVVRSLRQEEGLTQEQLGQLAGYKGGAGVSISRLESGQLEPGPARLEGIAAALRRTPPELADLAAAKTDDLKITTASNSESVMARRERLQHELDIRKQVLSDLEQALADASARANENFLMVLIEIAARLDGAPTPAPIHPVTDGNDARTEAAYRLQFTRYGVERALAETAAREAREKFAQAVVLGTLVLGPDIAELTGVSAALNGFRAATRVRTPAPQGGGTLGGLALLAVAAGGLFLVAQQRNRKQQEELTAALDEAEAHIAGTRPNVDALQGLMPRATDVLEYTAVHAGHALRRWESHIGPGQLDMQSLSQGDQQRYREFVEVAAAQIAVTAIDFQDLMTNPDSELERTALLVDEVLTQARKVITSYV